jgi:hypothetical protein
VSYGWSLKDLIVDHLVRWNLLELILPPSHINFFIFLVVCSMIPLGDKKDNINKEEEMKGYN